MARGWESKSVEQQQEEKAEAHQSPLVPRTPEQKSRERKRQSLLLSRQRLTQQLQAANHPRHRQMVTDSIAEVDRQLSELQ